MHPTALREIIDSAKREDSADVLVAALSNPNKDGQVLAARAIQGMSEKSQRIFLRAALQKDDLWDYEARFGWNHALPVMFERDLMSLIHKLLGASFPKPDFTNGDERSRIVALLK